MLTRSGILIAFGVASAWCALSLAPPAQAQDFFSLFGPFGGPPRPPPMRLPYVNERSSQTEAPQLRGSSGGEQAYCVRTCDGRYFPISGTTNQSRATLCNHLCPASQTKLVYGGNIDDAETDSGKPYSELPNAFRYRTEIVAGCTCNGKDQIGLASVEIEKDPTLRKGDIVAGEDGLMVAGRSSDKRGASLNLSPIPKSTRLRRRHVPVVAAE